VPFELGIKPSTPDLPNMERDVSPSKMGGFWGEDMPWEWQPKYNIAPTQMITGVIEKEGNREIHPYRWELN
jgi:putative SOS response-associated peptidase YedK